MLESKGFRISRSKIKYLHCRFSQHERREVEARLDGIAVLKCKQFRYLGSFCQDNGIIDEDVTHKIKMGWLKWRSFTRVLYDRRIPIKVKDKLYITTIRLTLLYHVW